jgi:bacteriocin biosynthesis cyclodehydratase domain-containing protein
MIDRIRLRENVVCEVLSEGVVLAAEDGSRLLTGRAERLVARNLDGSATLDEIIDRLEGALSAVEVCYVIERLTRDGLVVSGPRLNGPDRGWEALGAQPEKVKRLRQAEIEIVPIGSVSAWAVESVAVQLRSLVPQRDARSVGVDIHIGAGSSRPNALRVVLADDYLRSGLADANAESLASGRPWLLAKPTGAQAWVGPFFLPGETGCWQCLAQRLRGHRRVDEYLRQRSGADDVTTFALAGVPSVASVAAGLATTAVGNWIVQGRSGLEGAVWTLEARELVWRRHSLVKRPQCPACGEAAVVARQGGATSGGGALPPDPSDARPLGLVSRRSETVDGGLRIASPDRTFERLKHHISPITGIVSALVDVSAVSGSDSAVAATFLASHAFTNGARDVEELRDSLQRVAGGKGVTPAQARAGALCEALERYSGVFDGTESFVRARMSELCGLAIHPNECMLFSERQLSKTHDFPTAAKPGRRTVVLPPGARRIPAPFDPDAEIDWTPVWSLTHARVRYLPTAYCYYGAAHRPGAAFATADSNGCAAGNVIEEAILQGFLELVERDGVAIWWYNRLIRPRVDVRLWKDSALDGVMDRFAEMGCEIWVLDVTNDLGIPTFAALACNAGSPRTQVLLGFGAHLDAQIALRRAVTELVQSLPAVRGGASLSSSLDDPRAAALDWWATATVEDHPYLAPSPDARARTPADYPHRAGTDLLDAVDHCVETARGCGLETLVLDQTRPDVGLAVVKVFVPGLRHFWPRFAEGRLYDIPVNLGWRTHVLEENQLNPVPIYF